MGDPQAGWGSIVTMLCYTFLPAAEATGAALTLYTGLAALGTLLFLRSTGVGVPGSIVGALFYGLLAPVIAPHIGIAFGNLAYMGYLAWLPWLLLGTDVAIRGHGRVRIAGWSLAGFAASQELSTWLGQGAYYAFFATGAWLLFLTMLGPPANGKSFLYRLRTFVVHGLALSVTSVVLSAWTLVPRIEFILESNLQSGYGEGQMQFAGGAIPTMLSIFFDPGKAFAGGALVTLLLAAPFFGPRRTQLFYLAMCLTVYTISLRWLVDAARDDPSVRAFVGLIPGGLELHLHYPERISILSLFFGAALAGTALDSLLAARGRRRLVAPIAAIISVLALIALADSSAYFRFILTLLATIPIVALAWRGIGHEKLAAILFSVVISFSLMHSVWSAHKQWGRLGSPDAYYNSTSTVRNARLLRDLPRPGRFFGYYPQAKLNNGAGYRATNLWRKRVIRGLLLTTQATMFHLEDLQGYNPLHLKVYDNLLAAANGQSQHYRSGYVLPSGIGSPVLDMLSARYVLTTQNVQLGNKFRVLPTENDHKLHVNTQVLPYVWSVHRTAVLSDEDALELIASGQIDPRDIAAVSQPVQGVQPAIGADKVKVLRRAAAVIELEARMSSSGLVVISELHYPAWKVKVDGEPAEVLRVNGALRAVQVPTGTHTVTWYYSSDPTTVGFILSAASAALLLYVIVHWPRFVRRGSGTPRPASDTPLGPPCGKDYDTHTPGL